MGIHTLMTAAHMLVLALRRGTTDRLHRNKEERLFNEAEAQFMSLSKPRAVRPPSPNTASGSGGTAQNTACSSISKHGLKAY